MLETNAEIRRLIKANGYNLGEVASMCGVAKSTFSGWLSSDLTADRLRLILNVINKSNQTLNAIEGVKEYFKTMLDNPRIEDVFVYDGHKYKFIKLDTVEHILIMNKDICEIIRRNNEERGTM